MAKSLNTFTQGRRRRDLRSKKSLATFIQQAVGPTHPPQTGQPLIVAPPPPPPTQGKSLSTYSQQVRGTKPPKPMLKVDPLTSLRRRYDRYAPERRTARAHFASQVGEGEADYRTWSPEHVRLAKQLGLFAKGRKPDAFALRKRHPVKLRGRHNMPRRRPHGTFQQIG